MNHVRLLLLFVLTVFCVQRVLSQSADHVNGGRYTKTEEYNTISSIIVENNDGSRSYAYNTESKSRLEKMFFGDTNSPVEFFYDRAFKGSLGLRLVKDPSSDVPYTVELRYITNKLEIYKELEKKYPTIGMPSMASLSPEESEQIARHNREMWRKIDEESFDLFDIQSRSFPLYHLGDRLYEKMVALIDNFRAEGGYAVMADGDTSTFRCVVGDELWTLTIHIPQRRALQMSNLCRQMIEDAANDRFDEWKYVRMLEPIEF